jgi:hypothetical protein
MLFIPNLIQNATWAEYSGGTEPFVTTSVPGAFRNSSAVRAILSMSDLISPIVLMENFWPLYEWQKAHLFHGQFLVSLSSMLPASLGGLIGPISKHSIKAPEKML